MENKMAPVRVQRFIALLSVVLFLGKMMAFSLTHSVTVLTDALEGIVNMVAGFLGLFSITLAATPRDTNHPYGHGKAEFLSSAVEGTLIILSGFVIIYEGVLHLLEPHTLQKLDTGLIIIVACGLVNFGAGKFAEKKGKKSNSLILMSAGRHLQTDGYSTIAVIIGLALLVITQNKWPWLDSTVALSFALIIMVTGYKVLRRSLSGIMDEMDLVLLKEVIEVLQKNRLAQWVDLHNLRVIQYGSMMHVDAHMTLPYYFTVAEADQQLNILEELIRSHFNNQVELFVHVDGCRPYQCKLCAYAPCKVRQEAFQQQLTWDIANLWKAPSMGRLTWMRHRDGNATFILYLRVIGLLVRIFYFTISFLS